MAIGELLVRGELQLPNKVVAVVRVVLLENQADFPSGFDFPASSYRFLLTMLPDTVGTDVIACGMHHPLLCTGPQILSIFNVRVRVGVGVADVGVADVAEDLPTQSTPRGNTHFHQLTTAYTSETQSFNSVNPSHRVARISRQGMLQETQLRRVGPLLESPLHIANLAEHLRSRFVALMRFSTFNGIDRLEIVNVITLNINVGLAGWASEFFRHPTFPALCMVGLLVVADTGQ